MAVDDTPRRELVIDAEPAPGDSNDGGGAAMAPIALPVLAAGFAAKFVSASAGLLVLGAAVAFAVIRRKPNEGRFVLRIDDRVLEVTRERRSGGPLRVPLGDLLDVTLDRKMRAAGARGGATERMRLAFECREKEPVFVPEEHLTPIEAQEWLGKVRVFLRKHGWVPLDEQ